MKNNQDRQVEGEEPITIEEDAPAWEAGIEEAKEIMSACLTAAEGVCSDHGMDQFAKFLPPLAGDQEVARPIDQNVTNLAIAMFNSIVMMEMQRARADALQIQKLIPKGYIIGS